MNSCAYIFKIGAKKGTVCGKRCRGDYCWRHTPNAIESKRAYMEKRRESEINLEKDREYIRNKRKDPEYAKKELEYKIRYCQEHGISLDDLHKKIFHKEH